MKIATYCVLNIAVMLGLSTTTVYAAPGAKVTKELGACRGDSFRIDVSELDEPNIGRTPEERIEQLRDWVWPVVLGRLEATKPIKGLLVSEVTTPLLRDDALAHVLDHAVGSTRSAIAEDSTVVVMIERDAPAVMEARLLEAVDRETLHLAAVPHTVVVYGYEFDHRAGYADMCSLGRFNHRWIESKRRGFRRKTIRNRRDLNAFLHGGVDLLSAQCTSKGLAVTGRSRPRARLTPVTAEHIAALIPDPVSYVPPSELGVSWQDLGAREAGALQQMGAELDRMRRGQVRYRKEELPAWFVKASAWTRANPSVRGQDLLLSWIAQYQRNQENIGFSLDPKVRASEAIQDVERLQAAIGDPRELAALLYAWNAKPKRAADLVEIVAKHSEVRPVLEKLLSDIHSALRSSDDREALGVLARAMAVDSELGLSLAAALGRIVHEQSVYQCARYDGPLQGTEVGMTLFYTDLLMKLWSIDYLGVAPDELVPGFESVVGHEISSAYCATEEQDAVPYTRMWLGLRDDRYTREQGERARFAPVVTRIFAKGSALGSEYSKEGEAPPRDRRFVQWWNAHYAQVAEWEPQYELLNQIMKWSVAFQVASLSEQDGCLDFLEDVKVARDRRFDRWVTGQEELRWRGPFPSTHVDKEPTECMPLLRSRSFSECGGEHSFSGGVSLGGRSTMAARRARPRPRHSSVSHLEVAAKAQPKRVAGGRLHFDEVAKPDGTLRRVKIDPAKRSFSGNIESTRTQRGSSHSYNIGDKQQARSAQKRWDLDNNELAGRSTLNSDFGVARLRTSDITGTRVKVRVTLDDGGAMHRFANELSSKLDHGKSTLADTVASTPEVRKATKLPDGRVVAEVTMDGQARHFLVSTSSGPRGPPSQMTMRIGMNGGKKSYRITHLSRKQADALLETPGARKIETSVADADLAKPLQQLREGRPLDEVKARVDDILTKSPERYDAVLKDLDGEIRRQVRDGRVIKGLEKLRLHVQIRHGGHRGTDIGVREVPVDGGAYYAPKGHRISYAESGSLPGGASPSSGPGRARRLYRARLLQESERAAAAPKKLTVGDVEYVRHERPVATGAARLGRVYLVQPCRSDELDDEEDGSVRCRSRAESTHEEKLARERLRRRACSLGPAKARSMGVTDCARKAGR
ncbi:MAG: hypothetical protein Tsb0020_14890 [Haliangiales bacterium]